METGSITQYIDVAQVALYAFWVFFAGLIFYLRREDRREGYPLEDTPGNRRNPGVIWIPEPKVFRLATGETRMSPRDESDAGRPLAAEPIGAWHGAPLQPTGNPMVDGVGPAAYALRDDVPDMTFDGKPKIVPMRVAASYAISDRDPDPRGMNVTGADHTVGGKCTDVWIDQGEQMIRYLEVEIDNGRKVLVPMPLARVGWTSIKVKSITGAQFAGIPAHANPDQVTRLEEDKISAYVGSGHLYATPDRQEPLI